MDKTSKSKKKASNTTTPANQSVLAFNAMTPASLNSPIVRPPYDKGDKVATIF